MFTLRSYFICAFTIFFLPSIRWILKIALSALSNQIPYILRVCCPSVHVELNTAHFIWAKSRGFLSELNCLDSDGMVIPFVNQSSLQTTFLPDQVLYRPNRQILGRRPCHQFRHCSHPAQWLSAQFQEDCQLQKDWECVSRCRSEHLCCSPNRGNILVHMCGNYQLQHN